MDAILKLEQLHLVLCAKDGDAELKALSYGDIKPQHPEAADAALVGTYLVSVRTK